VCWDNLFIIGNLYQLYDILSVYACVRSVIKEQWCLRNFVLILGRTSDM
jgi:hypothetical protein